MKHEKLNPTLPAGHRWRKDYVLELDPGTHKRRYMSGYTRLMDARHDAFNLIKGGSAREISIHRYSASGASVRPHVVEIISKE